MRVVHDMVTGEGGEEELHTDADTKNTLARRRGDGTVIKNVL